MNEKLQTNPKYKKGEYKRWEQGQVTQEKLETLSACAKAHLELNLVRAMKGNKKGFYY